MAGFIPFIFSISILFLTTGTILAESSLKHLASTKQISTGVLDCDSSNSVKKALCKAVLHKVNSELQNARISIDKNGILFQYDNPKHEKIETGHSCSVTAEIRHRHASAHISSATSLNLKGNSLSRPLAVGLKLPVSLSARVDARKRFGARFFGKCKRVGRDSFSLHAGLSTTANVAVGFTLNPTVRNLPSGDFELTLRPVIAVLFGLQDTRLRFRVKGLSVITGIYSHLAGLTSTLGSSLESLFRGKSVKSIVDDIAQSATWDFGAPIVLGLGALPRPLEDFIFRELANYIRRRVQKKVRGFGSDLEDTLNTKVRKALKTDVSGKRVIVIKKNFIDLIRIAGVNADVYLKPPAPPVRPRPRDPFRNRFDRRPCRTCQIP